MTREQITQRNPQVGHVITPALPLQTCSPLMTSHVTNCISLQRFVSYTAAQTMSLCLFGLCQSCASEGLSAASHKGPCLHSDCELPGCEGNIVSPESHLFEPCRRLTPRSASTEWLALKALLANTYVAATARSLTAGKSTVSAFR